MIQKLPILNLDCRIVNIKISYLNTIKSSAFDKKYILLLEKNDIIKFN